MTLARDMEKGKGKMEKDAAFNLGVGSWALGVDTSRPSKAVR